MNSVIRTRNHTKHSIEYEVLRVEHDWVDSASTSSVPVRKDELLSIVVVSDRDTLYVINCRVYSSSVADLIEVLVNEESAVQGRHGDLCYDCVLVRYDGYLRVTRAETIIADVTSRSERLGISSPDEQQHGHLEIASKRHLLETREHRYHS